MQYMQMLEMFGNELAMDSILPMSMIGLKILCKLSEGVINVYLMLKSNPGIVWLSKQQS